jgi:Na+-translocating ferredoxin:NAD+ oxidoreductase RnfD subunit
MMKHLQKLGSALMLPVATLPICGILMGLGYAFAPAVMGAAGATEGFAYSLGLFLIKAGAALIDNMALLFAVGTAVGLAKENNGTAALAGLVSWLMMTTLVSATGAIIPALAANPTWALAYSKIANPFTGILAGIIGGVCYNKFKDTKLPEVLAFFSGKRSVAIMTGVVSIVVSAVLMLVWPVGLTRYVGIDGVTAATPLHHMVMPALPEETVAQMFLGNCPGSIGEISALALLAGGAYLVYRRVISVRIPAAYIGTVAVLTLVFSRTEAPVLWMLYQLFSGGLMLGAIFMATDYATSPATPVGHILYGIGCGVLTVVFRYFGLFPEGVTYAILIMNAFVWFIDRHTAMRRFGTGKGAAVK